MRQSSLYVALMLAVLSLMIGPIAAHAQATPTATPTPASCAIVPPGLSTAYCNTGAESPPSYLGVSGGNINSVSIDKSGAVTCCSGTFGALVVDASPGAAPTPQYVLSTNHTLARSSGSKGARANEEIVQPGLTDLGCWQDSTDEVAELTKWASINFKGSQNELDAAIAKVVNQEQSPGGPLFPGVDPLGRSFNLGQGGPSNPDALGQISTTPFPYDSLIDGLAVMKMGRSSCLTGGGIDAFDAMGLVGYSNTCNAASSGTALFNHQILVLGEIPGSVSGVTCTFASTGDSGALVVTHDFSCPQAIGIVFAAASGAGADSGGQLVAVNPIKRVLDKFKVSLVGQACTPTAMERLLNNANAPAAISDALHASIEAVRSVKNRYGRSLLRKRGVAAVGIGTDDASNTATLNVYLTEDTPEIRHKVLKTVRGTNVKFKHLGAKFQAL